MKIVSLNDDYFKNNLNVDEVLDNKKGDRPYYYSIDIENFKICIPFRTNATKIDYKYKVSLSHVQRDKPDSALDCRKIVIIPSTEFNNVTTPASIPRQTYSFLKNNDIVEKKFNNVLDDYITDKAKGLDTFLTRFSTMKNYHSELNLDYAIDLKRYELARDELIKNGSDNNKKLNGFIKNMTNDLKNAIDKLDILVSFNNLANNKGKLDFEDICKWRL